MNYEELYQGYQALEKELKEKINVANKMYKAIGKEMESGDLKSFGKDIIVFQDAVKEQERILAEMKVVVDGFDCRQYFEDGEFAKQMLESCQENDVDVKGEYPVYEMFPYKVRLDTENQDLYLDRKKVQCMRPQGFVQTIKAGRNKLMRAPFNALGFANELAEAYDIASLKRGKGKDGDLLLAGLYKILAPMGRYRRDYDQQSYAFDLARLYNAGIEEIKDGRKFQFGPNRENSKAIRILDGDGKEQFLATIRFYE